MSPQSVTSEDSFVLQTLDLLTDPHKQRGQRPQAIRQVKYHDDVRIPVLFVLRYKDIHASWINAVLPGPKNQDRFQGIRESRGDVVQELFGGVRLGSHQRTPLWGGWCPEPS